MELPPYRLPTIRGITIHMAQKSRQYLQKAGTIILAAAALMWFLTSYPKPQNSGQKADILNSYAGRLGKFLEPAVKPIGLDWKSSIAVISGAAAKETVISTYAAIYGVSSEDNTGIREKIRSDPAFSQLSAYSLMVFVLLYFPCLAAIVVFYKESRSIRETVFQIFYTTAAAYITSLIIYQGGKLAGLG
jgi:ferrous iron transport protein B